MKASLVVELYDYGKPLELELPPADQVVDAATLKHTRSSGTTGPSVTLEA